MSVLQLPAIAILGPTASGKSALGLKLAERGLPVEIISLDSALVFRGMNIGTAKPTAQELAQVPHHLIDIVSPKEVFNASQFVQACLGLIKQIRSRGAVPIILGGTMMYYKALTDGIDAMPQRSEEIRAQIEQEAEARGWAFMHELLAQVDPETAQRLKPADSQRIERALEVYRLTGKPISSFQSRAAGSVRALPTLTLLPSDRAQLHARIEVRFIDMMEQGLVQEVQALRARYDLDATLPSMRCVGYRQVWSYLAGEYDQSVLLEKGLAATRQLAKRQLTWLRSIPGQTQFDSQQPDFEQQALDWLMREIDRVVL